jgi:hypothetical protein
MVKWPYLAIVRVAAFEFCQKVISECWLQSGIQNVIPSASSTVVI